MSWDEVVTFCGGTGIPVSTVLGEEAELGFVCQNAQFAAV